MATHSKPTFQNINWIRQRRRLDFSRGYAAGKCGHHNDKTKSTAWAEGYQMGRAAYNREREEPAYGILDAAERRFAR